MKRVAPMVTVVVLALGLGACQGDTDPAIHVQAFSAQLNAHGRTDDGPATWWWELSSVLRGLSLDTTYFVRACGQDVNDAQQSCGRIIASGRCRTRSTASSPASRSGPRCWAAASRDDLTGSSGPDLLNGRSGSTTTSGAVRATTRIEARDAQVDGTFSCGESGGTTVDRDVVFADAVDPVTSSASNCELVNR